MNKRTGLLSEDAFMHSVQSRLFYSFVFSVSVCSMNHATSSSL